MHDIARRAITGSESIESLTALFYGEAGPLAERGWEIRASQREMSLRFARQIDGAMPSGDDEPAEPSVGLIEAPCGVGKGMAYLVPGFLAALRSEADFRKHGGQPAINNHAGKLMVSTANIALQGQLIKKDIPALGDILGIQPRATLMKSRQNYVCREKLGQELGRLYAGQDAGLQAVAEWTRRPGCNGDRENFPGDASEVWGKVSVGSDECGRQACPHFDGTSAAPCFWRAATATWPDSHIIVGNHHWTALSRGIKVIAYAVDEAHELEGALRSVQGRELTTSTFLTLGRRLAKLLRSDEQTMEHKFQRAADMLMDLVERRINEVIGEADENSIQYRTPVSLPENWAGTAADRLRAPFQWLVEMRDLALQAALAYPLNAFEDGEVKTGHSRDDKDGVKEARKAASVANKMAELCRMFAGCAAGRPHPDWPSHESPWAIWGAREKDGAVWRVKVEFVPADVAPAFGALFRKHSTMLLASATLPDFTSMGLSLGLGVRWTGKPLNDWPTAFNTATGPYARRVDLRAKPPDEQAPSTVEELDEPTSNKMATTKELAPLPVFTRRLPSPYPLERMGVLITPPGPSPKDRVGWERWAVQQVVQAVTIAGGGALILATSNAMRRRYTDALRAVGKWNVLAQGESGRSQVIADFKGDEDSVLVGTRSLFQGLDVQGRSCRLVVIDKIPFAPRDPLEDAIGDLLVERAMSENPHAAGVNSWLVRSVPEASMVLVQGIGRLIRSQQDSGAVVLLDNRLNDHGSGWAMIREALPPFPRSRSLQDIDKVLSGQPLGGLLYQTRRTEAQDTASF